MPVAGQREGLESIDFIFVWTSLTDHKNCFYFFLKLFAKIRTVKVDGLNWVPFLPTLQRLKLQPHSHISTLVLLG